MKTAARKQNSVLLSVMLAVLLLLCIIVAVCIGKYPITPSESLRILLGGITGRTDGFDRMTVNVVLRLRIPRILASVLVGAALSVSGSVYQGVFSNPLISPDFLGVSGGACVGAAIAILMALPSAFVQLFAFAAGVSAVLIALLIPWLLRNRSNIMLVLSGIIVGAAMSSILGFIKYTADPETELAAITYWTMGDFSAIKQGDVLSILPVMIPSAAVLFLLSWRIDILSLGGDEPKALGVNVPLVRTAAIICATLLTASSVCIAGTISWVGLVVPHFARMLAGPNHNRSLPASAMLGALFMLLADTLTRTVSQTEMPVSIVTGLIGAPLYVLLLYRERRRMV